MPKTKKFWIGAMVVIILLAYILPFTVFRHVYAWYGSFLCWGLVAVGTIFVNIMITKDWGKEE